MQALNEKSEKLLKKLKLKNKMANMLLADIQRPNWKSAHGNDL